MFLGGVLLFIWGCGDKNTSEDSNSDVNPDSTSETLFITEALDCSPNLGNGVQPGEDLLKVTLESDNAICNDGSPAIMYIRRATTVESESNWVFHLQGGGGCGGEDCATRWCSRNEKMTSTNAPSGMLEKGIFRRSDNTLGDANQVYLYYCSSDNWAGTQADVEIASSDETPAFRMHFQGYFILEEALSALTEGVVSDDGTETLPPLGGGGWALWTGTSGGCQGVMNTADRTAAALQELDISPWIICDANFSPTERVLPAGAPLDEYIESRKKRFEIGATYAKPALDQSCIDTHTDEEQYLCDWSGYVLSNHVVDAPLFIRMSLADGTISNEYQNSGFSIEEFASGVRSLLLSASSGEGTETGERPVSVYGPGCTQHVGLTNSEWFFDTVMNINGHEVTFHDAIVAWMEGRDVVAVDTVPPSISVCGTPTDETD
ncbi:MAG: hypothetical protein CL916_12580 [Deltaproteobacteria bacterium]|nr:hypothetical protein [Deltaproteobacteria bacterium]